MSVPGWVLYKPFLTGVSIGVPWFATVLLTGYRRHARIVGCIAALRRSSQAQCFLAEAPKGESLYQALMLLFSCLTFGAIWCFHAAIARRERSAGILFLLGCDAVGVLDRKFTCAACRMDFVYRPFLVGGVVSRAQHGVRWLACSCQVSPLR